MKKPRVLHCITVYNGRSFVYNAVDSALLMSQELADIDVLIMDDASPEPGWSIDLSKHCKSMGALYYRTPRNLGIPRNVSLGLRTALKHGYDYVTINNSDVIFPRNLIDGMIEAIKTDKSIGSVTALSNNVSIYSVPNSSPDVSLASQAATDFVADVADRSFRGKVVDIPAGISFCMMIPASVVQSVGVMDPVFGRGYCEETDWSLRSLKAGFRICLAPGVFVYHRGGGSNVAAGLVASGHTSVPENEAIIDMRHPNFRMQCETFQQSGGSAWYGEKLIHELIDQAALINGVEVDINGLPGIQNVKSPLSISLSLINERVLMEATHLGFQQKFSFSEDEACQYLQDRFSLAKMSFVCTTMSPLARRLSQRYETRPCRVNAGYPVIV